MTSPIRVLVESDLKAPLSELRTILGPAFEIAIEDGNELEWFRLKLIHKDGLEIALIRRDPVAAEKAGQEELSRLEAAMQGARPARAVEWLKHYFSHVKFVYTMEPLGGAEAQDEISAILRAQAYFWKKLGGILQADNEGFSNREGYHVLWQFPGSQQGELEAAVMDDSGQWHGFVMDMAEPEQVAAFQRGEVPAGAMRHE